MRTSNVSLYNVSLYEAAYVVGTVVPVRRLLYYWSTTGVLLQEYYYRSTTTVLPPTGHGGLNGYFFSACMFLYVILQELSALVLQSDCRKKSCMVDT